MPESLTVGHYPDPKIWNLKSHTLSCTTSGFRREVDENCAVLGYYAASSDNSLPTFRDKLSVPSSTGRNPTKILEHVNGTDRVPRNVGKELQPLAA